MKWSNLEGEERWYIHQHSIHNTYEATINSNCKIWQQLGHVIAKCEKCSMMNINYRWDEVKKATIVSDRSSLHTRLWVRHYVLVKCGWHLKINDKVKFEEKHVIENYLVPQKDLKNL